MKTANPLLSENSFSGMPSSAHEHTTIEGTMNKTFLLLIIVMGISYFSWQLAVASPALGSVLLFGGLIGGLVTALITIFKKEWARVTTIIYAGFQGLFLGAISQFFEASFPGIVLHAILITFGITLGMLFLYRTRIIKVTKKFRIMVVAATAGIMLVYLATFVLSFFGDNPLLHLHQSESGAIGIGFSLFVIGIASLNLFLDFDFIEKAAHKKLPKYMEWFGAFALLVTIIWIYIETLRLLAKLRR